MPSWAIHSTDYLDSADCQPCYGQVQNYLISHSLKLFFCLPLMINLAAAVKQLKKTLEADLVFIRFCLAEISSRKLLNQPIHYLYIIASFICHMRFVLLVFVLELVGCLHCLIFKCLMIAMASMGHCCLHCLLSPMMLLLILELPLLFTLFYLLEMLLICFEIIFGYFWSLN